jgi:hypothetical protein
VGGAQLEHHLVLVAQVDGLDVLPGVHVPEVQPVAVLAAEQQLRDDAVLDHRWRGPLRGDRNVLHDVPPDVVGQVLVAAAGLPRAGDVEGGVVEQRDPARAVRFAAAEAGHEHRARPAVHGVRPRVVGPLAELLGAQRLDQPGLGLVGLGVEHVQPGGPQARHDQVAPVAVLVVPGRAERAGAGIPAEVVQLVAHAGQLGEPDDLGVRRRVGVHVHHGERVGLVSGAGERREIGQLLGRGGGGFRRRAVERRVVVVLMCHG